MALGPPTKRSVTIAGHETSISLEPVFWQALERAARDAGLPLNALVTVQLADVSLADAPAAIIAERKITPTGQIPIPFELKFDSSVIQANHSYALQARITVDDKLMFINDERLEVDPLSAGPQTILLKMVKN